MKTALTIEESQRLIDLGVDPKLASMVSWKQTETWARKSILSNEEHLTLKPFRPMVMGFERFETKDVFTLADLLSILTKEIKQVKKHPMTMVVYWHSINNEWNAYYDYSEFSPIKSSPELIDALNSLLIWVLENNLNQENQ